MWNYPVAMTLLPLRLELFAVMFLTSFLLASLAKVIMSKHESWWNRTLRYLCIEQPLAWTAYITMLAFFVVPSSRTSSYDYKEFLGPDYQQN